MRYFWGLILTGVMLVGQADTAKAQLSLSIGSPGYGYGYNSYSSYGFGNGLYGAPVVATPFIGPTYGYSSGYAGYAPVVRPAIPYRGYGYGYSGYNRGYRGGFGGYRGGFGGYRGGFRR